MNTTTTTVRVAKCAGAGLVGIVTSCVLTAPALAMQPPAPEPEPGSGQHHKMFDSLEDRRGPAATPAGPSVDSTSDGIDWSTLAAALGGGMALTGFVALGATQIRRHRQTHPA